MSKFEPCVGASSDHAWRSIAVDFIDPTNGSPFQIQGATWNMQMWCTSQADAKARARSSGWDPLTAHSNNPMDITETPAEYFERKRTQQGELEGIMSGNDFVFLQEPDWLTHPALFNEFQAMLDRHGWSMVITPRGQEYQKLVTLYNPAKLELASTNQTPGLFKSDVTNKFRGFKANFTHRASQKTLSLVNLHLEFGKNYRDEMLALQKQLTADDHACIMGGDTNNVQNIQLSTMIGDWHAATNISADGQGGLTTSHGPGLSSNNRPIQKTYDGFFVNPGRDASVHITEKGGMRFTDLGNGRVQYSKYTPDATHAQHRSITGEPWQRTLDLRERLEQDKNLANPQEKILIDKKLGELSALLGTNSGKMNLIHLQPTDKYYVYAKKNRYHFYAVPYKDKVGDQAKATILDDLLIKISQCQTVAELDALENKIKASNEYTVLKSAQGIFTYLFGLKTDSLKALETMFNEAKVQLAAASPPTPRVM